MTDQTIIKQNIHRFHRWLRDIHAQHVHPRELDAHQTQCREARQECVSELSAALVGAGPQIEKHLRDLLTMHARGDAPPKIMKHVEKI